MISPIRAAVPMLTALLAVSSLTVPAQAGKYGSGGGRSYSSGSRSSFSSGSRSSGSSSASRPSTSSSTRSSYSSGTSRPSTTSSFSRSQTSSSSIDSGAARARQVQSSAQNFNQSRPAAPAAASGQTARSAPRSTPAVATTSHYSSRTGFTTGGSAGQPRRTWPQFSSYASRPATSFRDSYSPLFWWWLLDQSRPVRANWYYNHQSTMDPTRQSALMAADPQLQQEVSQLAAAGTPVNPAYTPPGIEPAAMMAEKEDLDDTTSTPLLPAMPADPQPDFHSAPEGSSGPFWLALLGGGGFVTWLVFFKRWQTASA